jgi:hypothetical protein
MTARPEDVCARQILREQRGACPPWPVEFLLVAPDFSRCSVNALGHGEELARQWDATLRLVRVEAG